MRVRIKRLWQDESSTWIAYTDFLTTVLTLFVIIAIVSISHIRKMEANSNQSAQAFLYGQVIDQETKQLISGCTVMLNDKKKQTDKDGKFAFEQIDLSSGADASLMVEAAGYETSKVKLKLNKGRNEKTVYLLKNKAEGESGIDWKTLPGDAFFAIGSAELKGDAVETLKNYGREFLSTLKPDEVIVIKGYTDDLPYSIPTKSNWELSGERAAAVCRVFQEDKYGVKIPGRQLILMGYGEFQPEKPIGLGETDAKILREKRAQNRCIKIGKLKGAAVFSTGNH